MLLTDDDITLTADQDLALVTLRPAIAQHLAMTWRTWLGETPYDTTAGVPYLQVIFNGQTDLPATSSILTLIGEGVPGITGISLDPLDLDTQTRELTVIGRGTSEEGPIDFSLLVGGTT